MDYAAIQIARQRSDIDIDKARHRSRNRRKDRHSRKERGLSLISRDESLHKGDRRAA